MNDAKTAILIDGCCIGFGCAPYIIAELSGNHNGELSHAMVIIEAAAKSGANAVKLQTYTADTLTIDHDGPGFKIEGGPWGGRTLYDLYQEASTPWDWHDALFQKGRELGVTIFSSPFDETAVDFLEELGCPAYKIASFEAADFPLLRKVASTQKPIIVSTGMVEEAEIEGVLSELRDHGASEIALLHCVSAYPAPPEASNLSTLSALAERYDVVVGLSDHTLGTATSVAAVALGASIIEKHVTLSRADGGVDSGFSLEPSELTTLVQDCKTAWLSLGGVRIGRQEAAAGSTVFRRSLYAVRDIAAGEALTKDNIRSIRPGHGLEPRYYDEVLKRTAKVEISRGTPLSWDILNP